MGTDWSVHPCVGEENKKICINEVVHEISADSAAIVHALLCLTTTLDEHLEHIDLDLCAIKSAIEEHE